MKLKDYIAECEKDPEFRRFDFWIEASILWLRFKMFRGQVYDFMKKALRIK